MSGLPKAGGEGVGEWLEGVAKELQQQKAEQARRRASQQRRENMIGGGASTSPARVASVPPMSPSASPQRGNTSTSTTASPPQFRRRTQQRATSQSPREFTTLRSHIRALETEWTQEKDQIHADNLLLAVQNQELSSQTEKLQQKEQESASEETRLIANEQSRGALEYQYDYEYTRAVKDWYEEFTDAFMVFTRARNDITTREEVVNSDFMSRVMQKTKDDHTVLQGKMEELDKELWKISQARDELQAANEDREEEISGLRQTNAVLEKQIILEAETQKLQKSKLEAVQAEKTMLLNDTVSKREHSEELSKKNDIIESLRASVASLQGEVQKSQKEAERGQKKLEEECAARESSEEAYKKLHNTYINDMQKLVETQQEQTNQSQQIEAVHTENTSLKLKISELEDLLALQDEDAAILQSKLNKQTADAETETDFTPTDPATSPTSHDIDRRSLLYETALRSQRAAMECRQHEIETHEKDSTCELRFAPSSLMAEGLSLALPQGSSTLPTITVEVVSRDTIQQGFQGAIRLVASPSETALIVVHAVEGVAVFKDVSLPRAVNGEKLTFSMGEGVSLSTGVVFMDSDVEEEDDRRAAQRLLRYKLSKLKKKHSLGKKQQNTTAPVLVVPARPSTPVGQQSPEGSGNGGVGTPVGAAILSKLDEKMAVLKSLSKTCDPSLQQLFQDLLEELSTIRSELGAPSLSPSPSPRRTSPDSPAPDEYPSIETIRALLQDVESLKTVLNQKQPPHERSVTPPNSE